MILLADDCLVFHTTSGEGVPYSAEMISVELMGDTASLFDPEFIKHAAAAVFHRDSSTGSASTSSHRRSDRAVGHSRYRTLRSIAAGSVRHV